MIARSKLLRHGRCAALLFGVAPAAVAAANITEAAYDPLRDELVVEIAYRGSTPGHDYSLVWGNCSTAANGSRGIAARLVDAQASEHALEGYRVRQRFSLAGLECRPAQVTLRLGPVSNASVVVPARPRVNESPPLQGNSYRPLRAS